MSDEQRIKIWVYSILGAGGLCTFFFFFAGAMFGGACHQSYRDPESRVQICQTWISVWGWGPERFVAKKLRTMGTTLYEAGRYDEAREVLQQSISHPTNRRLDCFRPDEIQEDIGEMRRDETPEDAIDFWLDTLKETKCPDD